MLFSYLIIDTDCFLWDNVANKLTNSSYHKRKEEYPMDNMQQSYIQESGQQPTANLPHAGAKRRSGLLIVAFILQIAYLILFATLLIDQKNLLSLFSYSNYEEYVMIWPVLDIVVVVIQTFVVGLFFLLLPKATQIGNRNVFMAAMLVCGILIVIPFSGVSSTISTIECGCWQATQAYIDF